MRVRKFLQRFTITELAHGAAPGADSQAGAYAYWAKIPVKPYPADWEAWCENCHLHRVTRRDGTSYCPVAGYLRNQRMLDEFQPDAVLALPGGSGTADMCRRAAAAGVEIHVE